MNLSIISLSLSVICRVDALSKKAPNSHISNRRAWIAKVSTSAAIILDTNTPPIASADVDALPDELKQFTALAPLGTPSSTGNKLKGLSLSQIASILSRDLVDGSTGKEVSNQASPFYETSIYKTQPTLQMSQTSSTCSFLSASSYQYISLSFISVRNSFILAQS